MRKKYVLFMLFGLFWQFFAQAQCPTLGSSFGTVQSITYNSNVVSVSTATNVGQAIVSNLPTGKYASFTVVKGFDYQVTTTSSTTFSKRLTLFNSADTSSVLTTANGAGTVTVLWTATFTGTLYVQLNVDGDCSDTSKTDSITFKFLGGSNTALSQDEYGVDKWIAHVYNFSDDEVVPLKTTSSTTLDANGSQTNLGNYLGRLHVSNTSSLTEYPEAFNQSFSGTYIGHNFSTGSSVEKVYTETFAIRFKMQTTKTGCYLVNIIGDDGVRLYLNGTLVLNKWLQQVPQNYQNILVNLKANDKLVLEYYEKNGGNQVAFELKPFDASANVISTITPNVCNGSASEIIEGSFDFHGTEENPTISFQWKVSRDNINFADVSAFDGGNKKDFSPPTISHSESTPQKYYYKRTAIGKLSNISSCSFDSNVIEQTISVDPAISKPVSNAASVTVCKKASISWGAISGAIGYSIDIARDANFYDMVLEASSVKYNTNGTNIYVLGGYENLDVGGKTQIYLDNLGYGVTYYYRVRAKFACGYSSSSDVRSFKSIASMSVKNGGLLGSNKPCVGSTQTYTMGITGANSFLWTVPKEWTVISPVSLSPSTSANHQFEVMNDGTDVTNITVLVAATSQNIICRGKSLCTTTSGTGSEMLTLEVGSGSLNVGTASADVSSGIINETKPKLTLSGYTGTIQWQSSTDNVFFENMSAATTEVFQTTSAITKTTYYRAVVTGGGCTGYSNVVTVTVNATAPTTISSGNVTICNGSTTTLTLTGLDSTLPNKVTWYYYTSSSSSPNNMGTQILASSTGTSITTDATKIKWDSTNNPTTATVYSVKAVVYAGANTSPVTYPNASTDSNIITITVLPELTPQAEILTQAKCDTPKGTVQFKNMPYGNYNVVAKNASSPTTIIKSVVAKSGPGTYLKISDLDPNNSYVFQVSEVDKCLNSKVSNAIAIAIPSTRWNGTSWSDGAPDYDSYKIDSTNVKNVYFDANYSNSNTDGNIYACDCEVKAGVTAEIDERHLISVRKNLNIPATASLVLKASGLFSASLLQVSDNPTNNITGTFKMEKNTGPLRDTDFYFFSSPVAGATLGSISRTSSTPQYFFKYSPAYKDGKPTYIQARNTEAIEVGKGYLLRAPKGGSPDGFQMQFVGAPNTGNVEIITTQDRYNLLGNPFPSGIAVEDFINDNMDVDKFFGGTLYFWTQTTGKTASGYTTNDYATCNIAGCTQAVGAAEKPDGIIQPGQGFYVKINGANAEPAKVVFNNSRRIASTSGQTDISVASNNTSKITNNSGKMWLNLTSEKGLFKQILIDFNPNSTEDFDNGYDAVSIQKDKDFDFFTSSNGDKMTILSKNWTDESKESLQLGFQTAVSDQFTFNIKETEGMLSEKNIILVDNEKKTEWNLSQSPYSFSMNDVIAKIEDSSRFQLKFQTSKLNAPIIEENNSLVWIKENVLQVQSPLENIQKITVYNLNGSLLWSQNNIGQKVFQSAAMTFANQILLVQVTLQNGKNNTYKVIN